MNKLLLSLKIFIIGPFFSMLDIRLPQRATFRRVSLLKPLLPFANRYSTWQESVLRYVFRVVVSIEELVIPFGYWFFHVYGQPSASSAYLNCMRHVRDPMFTVGQF